MSTRTATLIGAPAWGSKTPRFGDGLKLYRCDPPYPTHGQRSVRDSDPSEVEPRGTFVVASSAIVSFSGPETYLFVCNRNGDVFDWLELDGSRRGEASHAECFAELGYTIVVPSQALES